MRFLLDTHVLLWWLIDDRKLSSASCEMIAAGTPTISIAVLWEIAIKHGLGKLDVDVAAVVKAIDAQTFQRLEIRDDHLIELQMLPDLHRDPFDRLLVAQSLVENLPLMTVDKKIAQYQCDSIPAA